MLDLKILEEHNHLENFEHYWIETKNIIENYYFFGNTKSQIITCPVKITIIQPSKPLRSVFFKIGTNHPQQ